MSVIGRRQWAANEKAFKYEFSLEILKFICELPLPCSLRFMWKRNTKGIQTKNTYEGKAGYNEMNLNQKLSSISTVMYNTDTKSFMGKEAEVIVNMYFNGSPKKLASCLLDMRAILDPKDYRASRSQVFQTTLNRLVNQNSRQCKLTYRFSCVFKEEIMPSEKSIGGGPLNTSGFSMQQDKYFEKKYEVPSKDNHSVTSYTGNRYPSASKRERDDSSVRKFDYGYLAGLKSNISNQVTSKDFDANSEMKSRDNKTEMNDGNYLQKQLIDEQNKRSKAEAQLARNKVEISELKKKINELSIDNLKIKEEMKIAAGSKDSSSKEEINSLQFKVYELNNEIRQIKTQFQIKKREGERWQVECNHLKSQKAAYQSQLQEKQKKLQDLQRSALTSKLIEPLQSQNSDLKYQIQNLRRYIEQLKKQYADQQARIRTQKFRESQELSNQLDQLRRENQKMRSRNDITEEQQKKINEYEERLKEKTNEVYLKSRNLQESQKNIEEYKNRIVQYQSEKAFMQREVAKMKQESSDRSQIDKGRQEAQARTEWLVSENSRIAEDLRYYQQQLDEAHQNIQKIKQEQGQTEGRSAKLLPQINELQKRVNEYESQNGVLRSQKSELARQKEDLERQLGNMKQDMFRSNASTTNNPEVQRLFRESLQLQVDLKFANDELARLRGIQQAFDNEKWRAEKEYNDRIQLQKQFERVEKELVSKNRALMIQMEKTKMIGEQISQQLSTINFYKEELQKNRGIVFNMEEQLNDLSMLNQNQKQECVRLQEENLLMRNEKQKWAGLQEKVKELQARNNEKVVTLETLNRNMMMSKSEIKDLQDRNEELHRQLVIRDKAQYDLETRCKQIQKQRASWQSDLTKLNQQKRMLQKRNDMIVQQMHGMKKRFEDQKGRSLSFTRNQQFNKVRTLQSQIEKKQKAISKLNKEKLELQQQNVKINVQVMKLLSEMEKLKACSATVYSQTSYKTIGGGTIK